MSLTTFFQFSHTSYPPLPPIRLANPQASDPPASTPENAEQIEERGIRTAINMLHQPELMIALNPLVQHYSRLPPNAPDSQGRLVDLNRLAPEFNVTLSEPPSCSTFAASHNGEFVHYEIIDKFTFLGGLTSKLMTYKACFRPLYDALLNTSPGAQGRESIGLETISDPGSGVALLGKWVVGVDDTRPGFLVLTETVQVHCNVFLGWYVRSQLQQAHAQLHKEFGRRFCEEMVAKDPMKGHDTKAGKSWRQNIDEMKKVGVKRTGTGSTIESLNRSGTDELTTARVGSRNIGRVGTDEMQQEDT